MDKEKHLYAMNLLLLANRQWYRRKRVSAIIFSIVKLT